MCVHSYSHSFVVRACVPRPQGATYALDAFGAHGLLAGVNNKLQLYEFAASTAGATPSLRLKAEHCGHILVLFISVRGDFILVGDLMKSISLYQVRRRQLACP